MFSFLGRHFFFFFFLVAFILSTNAQNNVGDNDSKQPTIVTKDGSIIFQSALNGNISFSLNGEQSDVTLGDASLKELIQTVKQQANEIASLKNEAGPCDTRNPCGDHGVCVNVNKNVNPEMYKCICQARYTGSRCDRLDACSGVVCRNNGQCSVISGEPFCQCTGNWFGATCTIPKPTSCNFEMTEQSLYITSPGYPSGYPSNFNCTWKITTQPGTVIKLVVMETNIGSSSTCTSDYLQITDDVTSLVLKKLCGTPTSQTIYAASNQITLTFKTGATSVGSGFKVFYTETSNDKCGGRLTDTQGSFQSSMDSSSSNTPCIWVIDTNSKERLTLTFNRIKITNSPGRCDNYLEVRSGDTNTSPLFQKICSRNTASSSPPLVMSTKSSKLYIKFVRKDNSNGDMFSAVYSTECGGLVNLRIGEKMNFTTPFYPSNYPGKRSCKWVFHSPYSTFINLRFLDFQIEDHKTCDNDKVVIRTGGNALTFCGGRLPVPSTSTSNRLDVEFSTDGDQHFRGFQAEVSAVDGKCSRTFSGRSGRLSSPLYPSYYPDNTKCIYTIVAPTKEDVIQLSFANFDLQSDAQCQQDYIQIYDGDSVTSPLLSNDNNNSSTGGRLCGNTLPSTVLSSGQTLTIKFHSDGKVNRPGYMANWRAVTSSKDCDVRATGATSGFIHSPSYPSRYPSNRDCDIIIEAANNHVIQLEFLIFDLESSTSCNYDYVKIYDGNSNASRLIGTFCGNDNPRVLLSTGNFLLLKFHSDRSVVRSGFYANYSTGSEFCGGTLQGQSGFINSPGYPLAYPANRECNWIVKADVGNTVTLTISSFELQESRNCSNDSVRIYDGGNAGGVLLANLCGSIGPKSFTSTGRYIFVKFKSDSRGQWKGFSFQYRQGCTYNIRDRKGSFTSPGYPNAYPPNKRCRWNILGYPTDRITVTAQDFALEESGTCLDYVQFSSPTTARSRKYCRQDRNVTYTGRRNVRLDFVTDGSVQTRGFQMNYIVEGCSADFTNETGTFNSPGYPNNYPSNGFCVWRIRVPQGKSIALTFASMDIEDHRHSTTNECIKDFVAIYNGYDRSSPILGKYCSKRSNFTISSTGNEMTVWFKSSALQNRKGFSASYVANQNGCGGLNTGTHGFIRSPNYPHNYPAHSSCQWTIRTTPSQAISLTISNFHLERSYGRNCRDYLQVTDGKTFDELGNFCGRMVNNTILNSFSNVVNIKFFSDSQNGGKGFTIEYKAVCGGVINVTNSNGFLTSPNYPQYYEKGECKWLLKAPPGQRIHLQFIDFSIEACTGCTCDSLTIKDGSSNTSAVLGKVCGNHIPSNKISTGNNLQLIFKADYYQHHKGFKIMYTTDLAACGGHLKSISGNIISPRYPSSSPDNSNCVWTIEVAQGNVVDLSFTNIQLGAVCDSSNIKVFDGASTDSPLLKRLCSGNRTSSFKSSSHLITVQFYTRVSTIGFEASYTTDCSNQILTASSGIIESPGYPHFYSNNLRCEWKLNVPNGKVATIEVDEFDLEPAPFFRCVDYMVLLNRETNLETSSRYCSNIIPNVLRSAHSQTSILLISDGSLARHGFRLRYKIDDRIPDCGAQLAATNELQYFNSKNYPLSYPPNYYCKWTITSAVPGRNVQLQFDTFRMESDADCSYDYLTVQTGGNSSPETFCGTRIRRTPFISTGNSMTVSFHSDYAYQYRGFRASYKTVCEKILTDTKGIIKSEQNSSSSLYYPNTTCSWKIVHEQGGVIMLSFSKFNLQNSTNCTKDYVLVLNGVANDSSVLGRYCGNRIPRNVKSTNHEVTVMFVTDGEENGRGFELTYERQLATCGGELRISDPNLTYELKSPGYPARLPQNLECEWTLRAPEGSVIELDFLDVNFTSPTTSCSSTYLTLRYHDSRLTYRFCGNSPLRRKKFRVASSLLTIKLVTGRTQNIPPGFSLNWKIGCGRHFIRSTGNFTSRNFPAQYPNNEDCLYTIELLETNKQVQLHFPNFNLQQGGNDNIKVYDSINTTNLIGQYSGSSIPTSIVSSSNALTVQFLSDNQVTRPTAGSFVAVYNSIGVECGGSLRNTGQLSSPYFPSNYPIARRCKWTLRSTLKAVELNITDFDIQHSTNCTKDYLLVRNGRFEDSPVLGKYCGQNIPAVIYSTGSYMTVEFVSNRDNYRGKGFRAQFKSNHPACGGDITGDSGSLTSPEYPSNYPDRMECIWRISARDKHNIIQFQFHYFRLESHSLCNYDFLEIRGGSLSSSPVVNKLCGIQNSLGIIATTGPNAYLRFVSDARVSYRGFNVTWNATQHQCGGQVLGTAGEIKSPGYPNSYKSGGHTDCFWIGNLPEGQEVILNVTELNIPASTNCSMDRIIIQNGRDPTSPVIATLCGNPSGPMVYNMSSSHFRIHMISDGQSSSSMYKFKIAYKVREKGCGGMIMADEGIVTSPGYPNRYNHNTECEWVITTSPGTKVVVFMDDKNIPESCAYDFLEFQDGSNVNAPSLGKECGTHVVKSTYQSTSNKMFLRFVTDASVNGRGFKLHFNTGCNGVLKGRRGYLATPNYPLQYPNNQNCRWSIQTHPHFTLSITDINLNLPPTNSSGQCTDRIEVQDNITGNVLSTLCGNQNVPNYKTDLNEVIVRFVSDGKDDGAQYNGASASYQAVCGEHIRNSLNGTIDMKPEFGYYSNETCEWIIEFPVGKKISLETTSFLLESGYPSCRFDYLEIRDGRDSNAPLIGRWCSRFKPPHIQSSTNFIYIKFKTDSSVTRDGFSIKYSEQPLACGGNLVYPTNKQIASPTPLQPNTACGWKLTVEEGYRINITFKTMNLFRRGRTCTELVIIYDSHYPDERFRRTGAICGSRLPNSYVTISNKAFISFTTSSFVLPAPVNKTREFKASFQKVQPSCGGVLNATNTEQTLTVKNLTNNTNCEWVIIPPQGQKVTIRFPEFNVGKLNRTARHCSSGVIVREKLTIGGIIYCGDTAPATFHGSHPSMVIRARNFTQFDRFTLVYSAREDCNQNYNTESSGVVTSLNYPRSYPHHMNCSLLITAPQGKVITLYSAAFRIENPRGGLCRYDAVDIYDGNSISSTRLNNKTLCGRLLNLPTWKSTGTNLLIRFKTDSSVSHSGFAFSYTKNPPNVCGGAISGFTGAITTPNYPRYYGANLNCEWNITVAAGKKIRFSVPHFQTEVASDCANADRLEIFDGMTSSWGLFCGSAVPASRVSTSNQMRVTFKSNNALNNFMGFKLIFNEV